MKLLKVNFRYCMTEDVCKALKMTDINSMFLVKCEGSD